MRRLTTGVFGSRLAVAITASIVTAVVVAGGIAVASVPNNSVGSRKIINNSIRSEDIRNGAVKSVDIRDRTIRNRDIAGGARASTAVTDYNNALEVVEENAESTGNFHAHSATCPAGKRAVAGGGIAQPDTDFLLVSYSIQMPTDETTWLMGWRTYNNESMTQTFYVWALCAPNTTP